MLFHFFIFIQKIINFVFSHIYLYLLGLISGSTNSKYATTETSDPSFICRNLSSLVNYVESNKLFLYVDKSFLNHKF